MQIISSYGVELRKQNIPIRQTLEIYRSAVSYLIGIYVQVWEELAEIPDAKRRFNAAEHLVHIQALVSRSFRRSFPIDPAVFYKRILFPAHAGWQICADRKASLGTGYQNQNRHGFSS